MPSLFSAGVTARQMVFVRDIKVRVERIEVTLPALYGGIKGFQVDGKIGAGLHGYASFLRYSFSGYHQPEWQI